MNTDSQWWLYTNYIYTLWVQVIIKERGKKSHKGLLQRVLSNEKQKPSVMWKTGQK